MSAAAPLHAGSIPSAWIRRWSHLVPTGAPVLDVACGSGRHVRWFADRGHPVTAVDRDATALEPLRRLASVVVADLENDAWPLPGSHFGAVVVTLYLWRALLPTLVESVTEGGVWLYETFAAGNESVGKPSNPAFLLRPGELLQAAEGLRVIAYEDGFEPDPAPGRFVQRIAAVREAPAARGPVRHLLRA